MSGEKKQSADFLSMDSLKGRRNRDGKKKTKNPTLEFVNFKSPFQSDLNTPKLTMLAEDTL